jgi:hypothetical protein
MAIEVIALVFIPLIIDVLWPASLAIQQVPEVHM